MIYSEFKDAVRTLVSDGARTDGSYAFAISLFVKAEIARQIDHDLEAEKSYRRQYVANSIRLLDYENTVEDAALREVVRELITVDGTRRGQQDYIDLLITQAKDDINALSARYNAILIEALADLQHFVEMYRMNHETIYTQDDVAVEGSASHGKLPEGARIRQTWFLDNRESLNGVGCTWLDPLVIRWVDRVAQQINPTASEIAELGAEFNPIFSVDFYGREFYVSPPLEAGVFEFVIYWDGIKTSFDEGDNTPFDNLAAQAVAKAVVGRLLVSAVADNGAIRERAMEEFRMAIRKLFVESRRRRTVGGRL